MKKALLLTSVAFMVLIFARDAFAQWEIGGAVSGSAAFSDPGLRLEARRLLKLSSHHLDAVLQLNAQMLFPKTLMFSFPWYTHPTNTQEANFPPLIITTKNRRQGVDLVGMLRYHWKSLSVYSGLGCNVVRVNRKLLTMESQPYCEGGICVRKIPSMVFPSLVTQYAWSQHYGVEFRLSNRLIPYVEYSYYRAFKTFPFDYDELLRSNYGRLALGVRVPLSK